jgi:hypothetical protein
MDIESAPEESVMNNDPNDPTLQIPPKPNKDESSEDQKKITISDLFQVFIAAYNDDTTSTQKEKQSAQSLIHKYFEQEVSKYAAYTKYNILVLYDEGVLIRSDADKIYNSVTSFKDEKPILMVLFSDGGEAGTAYLIGKLCREYSLNGEFSVVVPRRAKSAATLICCAANEIHMGNLSELGPIDPQINNLPALGLKNSVEHIAEMAKKFPESSDMFAKYLNLSLKPIDIGYYERVAESALQYADRLLETHSASLPRKTKDVAFDLVYKYKDHGFVVDREEAETIFGSNVVKANTDEYEFGNSLYKALDTVGSILSILNQRFYHIGSLSANSNIRKI